MPYQEIQALGFPNSPRKLGLYEKPWACIYWYGPCTQLVNSKYIRTLNFQCQAAVGSYLVIMISNIRLSGSQIIETLDFHDNLHFVSNFKTVTQLI